MIPSPALHAIAPAQRSDARAFAIYLIEHVAESGRRGVPHFAVATSLSRDEVEHSARDRWGKALDEPLWGRAWLLRSSEPRARVIGHIELRGGRVWSEGHRAVVAMGILGPHTGQGHGRRLLETAIAWARDEAGLEYLDLGVFANNERARRLYAGMGFVPIGTREDAFRVDGAILDDIQMTLALRSPDPRAVAPPER
ncbi:GNAT family N-acetyltransferase [Sorangium atrum]|uniref:GNAT family N-acetyltransferase n=1 Tax=Sorangium atrum TaxID=2995308 RepID=A0ABT5BWQ4_9BACT|nr:GNAT family N-acetyltransferase [Sorangium aterium]MDC0678010.1 GNAT family N-acetyltransferase [Sorangium aterium]